MHYIYSTCHEALRKRMTHLEGTPLNHDEVTVQNRSSQSQDAASHVSAMVYELYQALSSKCSALKLRGLEG